jgi:hypothetical protein
VVVTVCDYAECFSSVFKSVIGRCSGSTIVSVGLANGGWFGLMLHDNSLDGRLMLNDNGLTLTDNGSPTAQPAHAQ